MMIKRRAATAAAAAPSASSTTTHRDGASVQREHRADMQSRLAALLRHTAWGYSLVVTFYLGIVYVTAPHQLINVNALTPAQLPLIIRPWVSLIIKLLGVMHCAFGTASYFIGPDYNYMYLATAAMNLAVAFVYGDALMQLPADVFPSDNVKMQIGLAVSQLTMNLIAFISF